MTAPSQPPALVAWVARPALAATVHFTERHPGSGYIGCLAALRMPLSVSEHDAANLWKGRGG